MSIRHLIEEQNTVKRDLTLDQLDEISKVKLKYNFNENLLESTLYTREILEIIKKDFNNLPDQSKVILELFINGFSHNEIAFFLDITPELSRQRVCRIVKILRKRFRSEI